MGPYKPLPNVRKSKVVGNIRPMPKSDCKVSSGTGNNPVSSHIRELRLRLAQTFPGLG